MENRIVEKLQGHLMVTKQSKGLWPVIAFLCGLGALVTVSLILYTLLFYFLNTGPSLAWKTWVWE